MIQIPDSRSPNDEWYHCGRVVARSVLEYHRCSLSYSERLLPSPTSGISPIELRTCFQLAGLFVAEGNWNTSTVKRLRSPFIAYVNASDGIDHYVIVRGIQRNRVYLFDPEFGLTSQPVETFESRWHSFNKQPIKNGGMLICTKS